MRSIFEASSSRGVPLLFAVLTVTPLVLLAAWSLQLATQAIGEQSRAKTEASAVGSAAFVRAQLQGLAETVQGYSRRSTVRDALADGRVTPSERRVLATTLQELHRTRVGVGAAFVTFPDGTLIEIAPRTPSVVGRNFHYRDWHRGVHATGATYVSEAYISQAAGNPHVVAVASMIDTPVRGADGHRGILVVAYEVSTLKRYAQEFARGQGVRLTITDQRGAVVADPTPPSNPTRAVLRTDGVRAALAGRSSTREMGSGDDRSLVAYEPVSEIGWTVSAQVSLHEATAAVRRIQFAIASATLVLLVLLALALRYLLRRIATQQETLRSQIEVLESKNRTLDTFSHTLVHDLRNPLAAITGFAMLLQDIQSDDDPQATSMLHSIEVTSRRMDSLIGDVLALATATRLAAREWVPFPALVEDVLHDVDGIAVEVGALPRYIYASRSDLYRSIKNLVENAVRYARVEGVTAWARIACSEEPNSWHIHVDDSGPGVPPAARASIFQSFQRGVSGDDAPSGTGLGLAIVAAFAEAHGGSVSVSDSPEGGARFTIVIRRPEAANLPPVDGRNQVRA